MSKSFEDLEVWKIACRLAVAVTKEMEESRSYAFRDQMIRSAVSIPSNIAEGAERYSNKDFRRFVYIALGSAGELRTQAYIACEANIINKSKAEEWIVELKTISKMLQSLANSLNREL